MIDLKPLCFKSFLHDAYFQGRSPFFLAGYRYGEISAVFGPFESLVGSGSGLGLFLDTCHGHSSAQHLCGNRASRNATCLTHILRQTRPLSLRKGCPRASVRLGVLSLQDY